LATNEDVGIIGDDKDLQRRRNIFGANKKPLPPPASFFESFKQEATNIIWMFIAASAILAGLIGWIVNSASALWEAISIIVIGAGIIAISVLADWCKDKQFV